MFAADYRVLNLCLQQIIEFDQFMFAVDYRVLSIYVCSRL